MNLRNRVASTFTFLRVNRITFFVLFAIAYSSLQLLTLSSYTLPWFDESFLASITYSLSQGKGFELAVSPLSHHSEQVLVYGPVYFLLTWLSTTFAGFTPWGYRLVNLLAAFAVVFLLYKRLQRYSKARWLLLLLLFDPIFLQDAHSGRMDMVALAFVFGSFSKVTSTNYTYRSFLAVGITAALALLTTPRIAFILLPLGIFYLIRGYQLKQMKPVWLSAGICLLIYFLWIIWAFGDVNNFISYYFQSGDKTLANTFIGINTQVPAFQWPLLISAFSFTLYQTYKSKNINVLQLNFMLPVIMFYLTVVDTGIYSALVVPFLYSLMIVAWPFVHKQKMANLALTIIICLNAGTAFCKYVSIGLTCANRNYTIMDEWQRQHIPAGARIVGDEAYYYAAISNQNEYQLIQWGAELTERISYHMDTFKPHYLMIGPYTSKDVSDRYKSSFTIIDSMTISYPSESPAKALILKLLNHGQIKHPSSFEGTVYQIAHP